MVNVIRFDEELTLEMSAFETLYGVQFTLSTKLIKPNYLVSLSASALINFVDNLSKLIANLIFHLFIFFLIKLEVSDG